jgi:hypothetical protein
MGSASFSLTHWTRIAAALALTVAACGVGAKSVPAAPAAASDEVGELLGDLMFHADLMSTLDHLCPARAAVRDWRSVIRTLPVSARTPELRELSRRLSTDAAQSMVRASGGCATAQYAQVYAATRNEYESLLEQWAQLSV